MPNQINGKKDYQIETESTYFTAFDEAEVISLHEKFKQIPIGNSCPKRRGWWLYDFIY
jgi:hypothetical protein